MSSDDIVLSVKNVSKCFEMYDKPRHRLQQMLLGPFGKKYYREFWALRDINFEVHRGECVGVIGRNGAGKSTLLQIVTGTLQPTFGEVSIQGRVAALLELGSGFNPEFTGRENVYMNAAILGLTKKETDDKFQEIVDFADIGEFIDQPVKTYSSGMMVRLAFAVNVAVNPDVLIVDEALAVGDAAFQRKCYARMESLIETGMTLFLVTHNTEAVKQLCQRVIYLKNGTCAFDGCSNDGVLAYMKEIFPKNVETSLENATIVESSLKLFTEDKICSFMDNHCYIWRPETDNQQYAYGSGGGIISEVRIYGLNSPNCLPQSGVIKLEIDAKWDPSILSSLIKAENLASELYIGYAIANKQNIRLFGGNTSYSGLSISPFESDHVTATFEVNIPRLKSGDYFVVVALSLGTPDNAVQLHWNDFAIHLVSNNMIRGGILYPDTKVYLKS